MSDGARIRPEMAATAGQWIYVCCECFVRIHTGARVHISAMPECAACGNTNIRFVHVLENINDGRQIEVGVDCARALLSPEEYELPGLAENEVKRKERWRIFYRKPGRCTAGICDLEKRGKL